MYILGRKAGENTKIPSPIITDAESKCKMFESVANITIRESLPYPKLCSRNLSFDSVFL